MPVREGGFGMTLEILMSCMHQSDDSLIRASGITGDAVVINQCDREDVRDYPTAGGTARMLSVTERGLTRSRNLAIETARADVCLLCDDDEVFVADYEQRILDAYAGLPQADVVIFKMCDRAPSFPDRVMELKFPRLMKVSSWQISFRRERLLRAGVRFDTLLGAGTGNGAEEELKFLLDCRRAGLRIFYAPVEIASVGQTVSTWFHGFNEKFFQDRGGTTRYILGLPLALLYGGYYVIKKRPMYRQDITTGQAARAILRGILGDRVGRQARQSKKGNA